VSHLAAAVWIIAVVAIIFLHHVGPLKPVSRLMAP